VGVFYGGENAHHPGVNCPHIGLSDLLVFSAGVTFSKLSGKILSEA